MATVPPSLVRLCEQQGIDLYSLPDSELLPAIIVAVNNQHRQMRQELAKSALVVESVCSYVPNPGIERAESGLGGSPADDQNESLNSLFPW